MKAVFVIGVVACLAVAGCSTTKEEPDLVFHCTFDDVQSVLAPAVGLPGMTNGASFVEGKVGNALHVPAHAAVAEFPFPNGLPTQCGTIEFWAKIENDRPTFSDGVDPYLFIVTKDGVKGWNVVFECNFNANNGCGASGFFCGMSYGRAINVSGGFNSYASILGAEDPMGWHKYEIVWNRKGLDESGNVLQVSIDGKPRGSGIRSKRDVDDFFGGIGSPVRLVLSNPRTSHGKSAVTVDEFKVWSTVRKR